jgi:hypothetical protein
MSTCAQPQGCHTRLQLHARQGNGQSLGTSEQSSETLFHLGGYLDLGLPNDGPVGRDDRAHAFPSVVGTTMGLSGHRRVYCMMLLGHRTSYSLPRRMRALFGLSQTLQDTISFQHVDKRRGVRGHQRFRWSCLLH